MEARQARMRGEAYVTWDVAATMAATLHFNVFWSSRWLWPMHTADVRNMMKLIKKPSIHAALENNQASRLQYLNAICWGTAFHFLWRDTLNGFDSAGRKVFSREERETILASIRSCGTVCILKLLGGPLLKFYMVMTVVCRYKQQENDKVIAAHAVALVIHAIDSFSEEKLKVVHKCLIESGGFKNETCKSLLRKVGTVMSALSHQVPVISSAMMLIMRRSRALSDYIFSEVDVLQDKKTLLTSYFKSCSGLWNSVCSKLGNVGSAQDIKCRTPATPTRATKWLGIGKTNLTREMDKELMGLHVLTSDVHMTGALRFCKYASAQGPSQDISEAIMASEIPMEDASKGSEPTSDDETETESEADNSEDDDEKKSGRGIRARDIKLPHAVQQQLTQIVMTWKVWPIPHSLQRSRQISQWGLVSVLLWLCVCVCAVDTVGQTWKHARSLKSHRETAGS